MSLTYKVVAGHLTITDGCEISTKESNIILATTSTGRENTGLTSEMDRNLRGTSDHELAPRTLLHANLAAIQGYYLDHACDINLKCPRCQKIYQVTREDLIRAIGE